MNSLKNEINIKPLRVWSDNSIYGALLIGYLAHLIISLIRYDEPELGTYSTKFIKISLSNLTVTIEKLKNIRIRRIYSNFDPINELICLQNKAITQKSSYFQLNIGNCQMEILHKIVNKLSNLGYNSWFGFCFMYCYR